jgi:L-lactate dehydrogenase complex protein LldG
MTNREIILSRIREGLKVAASHPGLPATTMRPSGSSASPRQWLPPVGESLEEQIELFRRNAEQLKAEFRVCADADDARQYLQALAAAGGWRKVGLHGGGLVDAVASRLGLPVVNTDGGYALGDLEACDAALTECEVFVAQTGSVLVSAGSAGGRALSVLPPHHIVLARRSQMVPDLAAALRWVQEKFKGNFPSFLSFITGPSRTGDIERILVLGAHGPKKLTLLLLP